MEETQLRVLVLRVAGLTRNPKHETRNYVFFFSFVALRHCLSTGLLWAEESILLFILIFVLVR